MSTVTCDAAANDSALTVQLTGIADKTLLEVSLLLDPDKGPGTYDLTKEAGQGGVAISDQTPPGGDWGPAVEPSTATLDSAGTGGTFSVTADRYGYSPIQIAGSWNCSRII